MRPRRWLAGEPIDPLREALARGAVLAIPTESSYGLGVDPRSAAGVEAIYRLKGRERGRPLPVVISGVEQLALLPLAEEAAAPAIRRAMALWPAPLSLVLPLAAPVPAAAGGHSLAVRVPAHAPLRALLAALGTPLTATSANATGEPPALHPAAVANLLAGTDAVIVDGGSLPGGPPSTLAVWEEGEWRLVRPGPVTLADLNAALR